MENEKQLEDFTDAWREKAMGIKRNLPYLDKSYADKRRILREYSIKDQIRDYLDLMTDECISGYNTIKIPNELSKYEKRIGDIFSNIISKFGFKDGISSWITMKDFLVDGFIALEIIWDNQKENILSFNKLRAETLVPSYERNIGSYWIQFPEDNKLKRILLDSQIIFIQYNSQNDLNDISYVESLIKPYNQLKIIEQSLIMFNINNATTYKKFTIPVKGLSKTKAEEQIGQLIANYSEHVEWDDTIGTLTINGSKHLPFNKQVWFPDGDCGTHNVEILPTGQPNANTNYIESIEYFTNSLKRASRIPNDTNIREQRRFINYTNRVKSNFKEIILKPLILQTTVEFPELIDNIYLKQIIINL